MTILKKDEALKVIYTTTGIQEEIIFNKESGYPLNGTVRVIGGASDVFTIQTNIAGDWVDNISSNNGKINDLVIIGRGQGIRLKIDTNTSGSIKLEILL